MCTQKRNLNLVFHCCHCTSIGMDKDNKYRAAKGEKWLDDYVCPCIQIFILVKYVIFILTIHDDVCCTC